MATLQYISPVFIPVAAPVAHACCAACDEQWPDYCLEAIDSDAVYRLYVQDYSLERDDLICPGCMDRITSDYQPNDGSDAKFENSRFGRNR